MLLFHKASSETNEHRLFHSIHGLFQINYTTIALVLIQHERDNDY